MQVVAKATVGGILAEAKVSAGMLHVLSWRGHPKSKCDFA